ncbi:unnamed protein product [Linum trigynum]|uniref:Tetraspanin-8 n=1 Tax=Linum trigynum TaxID=586398 RepID=A0AAV2D910_9ROSI
MVWLTNCIFSILNVMIMLLGIATMATAGIMQLGGSNSDCQKWLQSPLLIMGCFLFFISLMGLIGTCCRMRAVLWIYSFLTFLMILAALAFVVFALVVTNSAAGKALTGVGYEEYRLRDYSDWLRDHFVSGKRWSKVKSCMADADVCLDPHESKSWTILQASCCKPPDECGFVKSGNKKAMWVMPPRPRSSTKDADCAAWSNDPSKKCFDCSSCKAGVLEDVRKEWRTLAIINLCVLLLFVLIYSVSCCARRGINPYCTKNYKGYYYP